MASPVPGASFSLGSGGKTVEVFKTRDTKAIMVQIVQPSTKSALQNWTMRLNLFQYQKLNSLNVKIQKTIKKLQEEEEEEESNYKLQATTSMKSKNGVY